MQRVIPHNLCVIPHKVCNFTRSLWFYTGCVILHWVKTFTPSVQFYTHCVIFRRIYVKFCSAVVVYLKVVCRPFQRITEFLLEILQRPGFENQCDDGGHNDWKNDFNISSCTFSFFGGLLRPVVNLNRFKPECAIFHKGLPLKKKLYRISRDSDSRISGYSDFRISRYSESKSLEILTCNL